MNNESDLKRVATGIAGLDDILNGGFPSNRLYLVDGDPGSGKTSLGLQYLIEGVRLGERSLYVTLSETKAEILSVAQSHGWDLSGIEIFELGSDSQLTADDQSTFYHPSEIELGETTKLILDEITRINPSRIVFDSLSELRLLARESLRYRRQILALKQYFVGRNMTVMLLDDRTSEMGDLDLHSLVHGVIRLEQLSPEYGADRRRLRVLKMRGVGFRGGFHDFVLKRGGLCVFPRLVAREYSTLAESRLLSSNVSSLDKLVGGGIDRGAATLLMGPAGSGKSTLSLHYAMAAAKNGEKTAVFAFDEGKRSVLKRAKGLGFDLSNLIESGKLLFKQVDPAELSPGEFVDLVCRAVNDEGASVVIIDSLNGYLNAMPEERFLTIQMHELLSFLNQKGVVTFLIVAQHGLIGTNMNSPVDVSYLADTVIVLRYFEVEGAVRKAISVLKRRSGPHESTIHEIRFADQGLTVGEPLNNFRGVLSGIPETVSP